MANVNQLKVFAGFTVSKFAEDLGKPRIITVNSTGHVYVTDREAGTVTMLQDTNGDGVADARQTVAIIKDVYGLTIQNNQLYMVTVKELYRAAMNPDGTLGQPQLLISDLPDGGQHPNRTIHFDPDGLLYISIGSTCNACPEPNQEHATLLRANPDGTNRKIFAEGLRNIIGFGWHPQTSELWGMDHCIDWLGDNAQREELNNNTNGVLYRVAYNQQ